MTGKELLAQTPEFQVGWVHGFFRNMFLGRNLSQAMRDGVEEGAKHRQLAQEDRPDAKADLVEALRSALAQAGIDRKSAKSNQWMLDILEKHSK